MRTPISDDELDDLLRRSATQPSGTLAEEARRLASAARPPRLRERRPRGPRARWLIPAAVAGSIALTGGTTLAATQLLEWPYVGMPADHVRTSVPIPVEWTTESGHTERCSAWLELEQQGQGDRDALDAAITAHDWTGFGQRLYDSGTPVDGDADGERRVSNGLEPELYAFAQETLPGLLILDRDAASTNLAAWGLTCRSDQP